jgi:RNA-directed DNA polymerase
VNRGNFEAHLEGNLKPRGADLQAERLEPQPGRRTDSREIKAGGRLKRRPRGIPAIRERIVQEVRRMVLAPIWEADCSRHSYGCRPDRSTQEAGADLGPRLTGGPGAYGWGIAGASQSCFDPLNHHKRRQRLRRRTKDNKRLSLVGKFRRAHIMAQGRSRHAG